VASSPQIEQENALIIADMFLLLPQLEGPHDRRHDVHFFYAVLTKMDMWHVIKMLSEHRLVTISGAPGVGKSALIAGSCQYLATRDVFKDGIIFVCLDKCALTQSRFLELIEDQLVQQRKAVQAIHRLKEEEEEDKGDSIRSADSSSNPSGGSSSAVASTGGGNCMSSPLLDLPHPRVPRAGDEAALQLQKSQADIDADREAWIMEALRDRTALLVVDHAHALIRDKKGSDEEEGGGLFGFLRRMFDGSQGALHMEVLLASENLLEGGTAISSGSTGGHSGGLSGGRQEGG